MTPQTYNSIKAGASEQGDRQVRCFYPKGFGHHCPLGLAAALSKGGRSGTDAQVKEQAKVSLEYYNRVLQQLKFTSLGVNSLRAGQLLLVNINDLDGDPFRKYVMLEKVSHTWENDLHTMELEAKAL